MWNMFNRVFGENRGVGQNLRQIFAERRAYALLGAIAYWPVTTLMLSVASDDIISLMTICYAGNATTASSHHAVPGRFYERLAIARASALPER